MLCSILALLVLLVIFISSTSHALFLVETLSEAGLNYVLHH